MDVADGQTTPPLDDGAAPAAPPAPSVSDDQLVARARSLLLTSDLNTVTSRAIREQLAREFAIDLTDRKAFLDSTVMQILAEILPVQSSQSSAATHQQGRAPLSPSEAVRIADAVPPPHRARGTGEQQRAPPERTDKSGTADAMGVTAEDTGRSGSSSAVSDDDNDGIVDANRKTRRTQRHSASSSAGRRKRRAGMRADKRRDAHGMARPARTLTGAASKGGLRAAVQLSEPLAALVGSRSMPRTQVIKRIWELIKARNLQDPANRRAIICTDADMRAVFNADRVTMFQMPRILKRHMTPLDAAAKPGPGESDDSSQSRTADRDSGDGRDTVCMASGRTGDRCAMAAVSRAG